MTRLRRRRMVFFAIGLVLFAVCLPTAAVNYPAAILEPLWLVPPPAAIALICREASHFDEQTVALLSLVASRAPPPTTPSRNDNF